jgi:sulfide:quinone oxidoreductase
MSTPAAASQELVILGGGIAGIEALLAARDLVGDRARLTLISPEPDFLYKPLSVEEPFSGDPARRFELPPFLDDLGGRFVAAQATRVRPEEHLVELSNGADVAYDRLIVCLGARAIPPFEQGTTLRDGATMGIDGLLRSSAEHPSRTLAVVLPPGPSWPLPAYELGMMIKRRSTELEAYGIEVEIVTPEEAPLMIFGRIASDAVAELLRGRGIKTRLSTRVSESPGGELVCHPGGERLEVGEIVALPRLEGPALPGLPCDEHGFIPIDTHSRVVGVEHVWAAGDGADFPVKQGGLATQQADAAVEDIAASLGSPIEPQPFKPVMRGQLLTGDSSLYMQSDLEGGHGEGGASSDALWWPPNKVVGRYLAAFLAGEEQQPAPPPSSEPLDVEVSLPQEWHGEPMALDPVSRAAEAATESGETERKT